jgi:heme ABC exporter ATP-binding subunit CcmA
VGIASDTAARGSQPDVRAEDVERRFGRRRVLEEVSFDLEPGGFLLLLGPNGAGKTTLLRILATLLSPSGGSIRICGHDVREDAAAVRRLIGFVGHSPLLYGDLTARENLRFYARMYQVADSEARVAELLDRVELTLRADDPAGALSKGMRQRLALARALLHDPRVLLLDEPYAGLDTRAAGLLDELLDERAGRTTVVLVTHDPGRPAAWASAALTLAGGHANWSAGPSAVRQAGASDRPSGPAAPPGAAASGTYAQAPAAPGAAAQAPSVAAPDVSPADGAGT